MKRYCVVCGYDITAYYAHAITCGEKCRQVRGMSLMRAHGSFKGARDRGAVIDPAFTPADLREMIDSRGDCYLCGDSLEQEYHIDHILSVVRGGRHEKANIGFLCPVCNVHKGARTVTEYLDYLRDFDLPRLQRILSARDAP